MAERSGGEVELDIDRGGALSKAVAAAKAIRDGVADLGAIIAVCHPQEMAGDGIADLPQENPNARAGMRTTGGPMRTSETIQPNLADKGLVCIGTFTASAVDRSCRGAAIRTAEDIDGLEVRGVGAYGDAFDELVVDMVNMLIHDAYGALDTGLIDRSHGYSYAVFGLEQGEVMDSDTLLDRGQVGTLGIFVNAFAYDALAPEQQDLPMEVGAEMADEFGRLIDKAEV